MNNLMGHIKGFFLVGIFCFSLLNAKEGELLQTKDIYKVMDEIFHQHVDQKEMSTDLMRDAFRVYIEQFDPNHIYFLDGEVTPFLQLSESQVKDLITSYQKKDLSAFTRLNDAIQKSIERSRELRKEVNRSQSEIFKASQSNTSDSKNEGFAKTIDELKARIKNDMARFIHGENERYGSAQVTKRREDVNIALYEKERRLRENQYLAIDDADKPLPAPEKENLFSLHVLKAMTNSLDAHTSVLNNREAQEMKIRLEKKYLGIGIELKKKGKDIVITKVMTDSPAAKSGSIKVNDRLVKVNDKPVTNEALSTVLELLQGTQGSSVTLEVKHPNIDNLIPVTLTREIILVNEGRVETAYELFGNGIIGKVALHSFYQGPNGVSTDADLREAIQKLRKQGNLRGLIIDLRDNTGGFLTQAVNVVSEFISRGIVVIAKYANGDEHIYRDVNEMDIYDGPIVVLTSKETASAAEIVAQALQDYGVALIVGDEHTFGKGTIQSQTVTGNDSKSSFFKVTVGKYYTVSGHTPQKEGVKADIVVPSELNKEAIGEEYLEHTLSSDTIPALYNDPLTDIDPAMRSWYMRYYSPTVQRKNTEWQSMVPVLKKNSEYRINNNKEYQAMMKRLNQNEHNDDVVSFTDNDLQMEEAVNIVKDMILLHSQSRSTSIIAEPVSPEK